jgi:SPX domain protein involved in polyphosphate accumulation
MLGKFSKSYPVISTYFDDEKLSDFYAKLDGHFSRKKIRIRSYSELYSKNTDLFLERKIKTGQKVSKQRMLLSFKDYEKAINGTLMHPWLAGLKAKLTVIYQRDEYVLPYGRVTVDKKIRFIWNGFIYNHGLAVLEIKTEKPLDAKSFFWLGRFSQSEPFSKYAEGMKIKLGIHE